MSGLEVSMEGLAKAHLAHDLGFRLSGGCLAGCVLSLLLGPSNFSGSAQQTPNCVTLWRRGGGSKGQKRPV